MAEFWRFDATDEQRQRMLWALQVRERAWELNRRWSAAEAQTGEDAAKARAKVLDDLTGWQGRPADAAQVEQLLAVGLQPTPDETLPDVL